MLADGRHGGAHLLLPQPKPIARKITENATNWLRRRFCGWKKRPQREHGRREKMALTETP